VNETVLLTGATGSVGGALVLELLRSTEAEVVCLVRPKGPRQAADRMRDALERACGLYDEWELLDDVWRRCSVLEGDLLLPGCGVSRAERRRIDEVWHVAGLRAPEADEGSVRRATVEATRGLLQLAVDLGATSCNHFGDAVVGPLRDGVVVEEPVAEGAPVGGPRERAERDAERLALAAPLQRVRVFRPSLVVGHSATHAATSTTGFYQLIGDVRASRPPRPVGGPDGALNCLPVDLVAREAVAVARSASAEEVFHLTSVAPAPSLGEAVATIAAQAGVEAPEVPGGDRDGVRFDRAHTDAALGAPGGDFPLCAEDLGPYVDWYLRHVGDQVDTVPYEVRR
jgi:thioester reductase-like protein